MNSEIDNSPQPQKKDHIMNFENNQEPILTENLSTGNRYHYFDGEATLYGSASYLTGNVFVVDESGNDVYDYELTDAPASNYDVDIDPSDYENY